MGPLVVSAISGSLEDLWQSWSLSQTWEACSLCSWPLAPMPWASFLSFTLLISLAPCPLMDSGGDPKNSKGKASKLQGKQGANQPKGPREGKKDWYPLLLSLGPLANCSCSPYPLFFLPLLSLPLVPCSPCPYPLIPQRPWAATGTLGSLKALDSLGGLRQPQGHLAASGV